jgi:hypothetical protein
LRDEWRRLHLLYPRGPRRKIQRWKIERRREKEIEMVYMVGNFDVGDYDTWKKMFDSDPGGRAQSAKGHTVSRNVDNPSDVFVRVEFDSVDDAKTFRERLLSSGALNNVTVKTQPTIIEVADEARY